VTLRTGGRLQPNEILALTRAVLRDYGVSVLISDNLARIVQRGPAFPVAQRHPRAEVRPRSPKVSGRSTNICPWSMSRRTIWRDGCRPRSGQRSGCLRRRRLNAILLLGLPDDIQAAQRSHPPLCGPAASGRAPQSSHRACLLVRPASSAKAGRHSSRRKATMSARPCRTPARSSYSSLRPSNSLVVFAADQEDALLHVEDWARDLDRVAQVDPQRNLFTTASATRLQRAWPMCSTLFYRAGSPSAAAGGAAEAVPPGARRACLLLSSRPAPAPALPDPRREICPRGSSRMRRATPSSSRAAPRNLPSFDR